MNNNQMPNGFADSEYQGDMGQAGPQPQYGNPEQFVVNRGQAYQQPYTQNPYQQNYQQNVPQQMYQQGYQQAYQQPVQNGYNQQPMYQQPVQQPVQQPAYQQPYTGYQAGQQNPYGQQAYTGYQGAQQAYTGNQGGQQAYAGNQGMQQQAYGGYQQPVQQMNPQDPYAAYAQQQGQPLWQSNQMQPVQPVQQNYQEAYAPAPQTQKPYVQEAQNPFPVALMAICAVVVILCVCALVVGGSVFRWIAAVVAILAGAALWLIPGIAEGLPRLVGTGVTGILALLCVIFAISAPASTESPEAIATPSVDPASVTVQVGPAVMPTEYDPTVEEGIGDDLDGQESVPETTPAVQSEDAWKTSDCAQRLTSFFHFWSVNNTESMVTLTAPSWQRGVTEPKKALFSILSNRIPRNFSYVSISSYNENDVSRTVTVDVEIDKQNMSNTATYRFKIVMLKEDENWYVDPRSLESNETATATATNSFATQPPTPQPAGADTILYYNTDGGSYYHADPNCSKVGQKYRPLTGTFRYYQVNDAPYSSLKNCTVCGAPLRNQ